MKYQISRAARSAATAIALTAAAGAVTVSHSADAQSPPPAVQWRVEDGGNGHWYQFMPYGTLATWDEAMSYANERGGHLATILSSAEQSFAYAVTTAGSCEPTGTIWLGADQPPGSPPNIGWRWVTGEPWGYTNWSPGEPNDFQGWPEDCLVMLHPGGSWYDIHKVGFASPPCTRAALIEWSADCNGDGVVDYGQIASGQFPDVNGNGVPDQCECLGDVTANGNVDGVDLAALLSAWGTNGQGQFMTDIDGDGIVGGADLAYVLSGWGPCPE